jgi:hypothetical protein
MKLQTLCLGGHPDRNCYNPRFDHSANGLRIITAFGR